MEMRALSAIRRRFASDWLLYLLFPLAALCLPWMVRDSGWFPGAEALTRAALWAGLAAVVLAYTRLRNDFVWLLGWLFGFIYSVQFAADLTPPPWLVRGDVQRVAAWLRELLVEQHYNPDLPLSYSATFVVERLYDFGKRAWDWVTAVQRGIPSTDNAVLQWSGYLLVWLLSFNLGYQLFRTRRGLAGLVPLGVIILTSISFTGVGTLQAQIYFASSLILWLWSRAGHMQLVWAERGTRVAPRWRRHLLGTGFPVAGLVFVLALAMPYKSYDRAVYYFWEHMGHRLQTFYQKMDRAFAGRNPLTMPKSGTDSEQASLGPHDIRTGVNASDRPVFMVRTSDPAPDATGQGAPKRYWRERTYDQYTGVGWDSSPVEKATFAPNALWKEVGYPRQVLTQTYTLLEGQDLALTVNEPVVLDSRYTVLSRGAGDLAGLSVADPSYTVTSLVPDASVEELRKAEGAYADWMAERYLALPQIPRRVRAMAERVVQRAGATTRYDKARAIEAFLRGYTYDTNVASPPWKADVVEYFLFTARRGYCDYSATAMVVMLRSVGVAARYASGYGQGIYDTAQGAWVVSGKNAHAWTEVYFPGYGWIEFEPTPAQGLFTRADTRPTVAPTPLPTESTAPAEPSPEAPQEQAPDSQPLEDVQVWARDNGLLSSLAKGGLLLFLVGLIMVSPRLLIRPRPTPKEVIWRAYGRLRLCSRLLGMVPQDNMTPRESLSALQREIERRSAGSTEVAQCIDVVQSLYERARYGAADLTLRDGDRAWEAWTQLRDQLRRLLWPRSGKNH